MSAQFATPFRSSQTAYATPSRSNNIPLSGSLIASSSSPRFTPGLTRNPTGAVSRSATSKSAFAPHVLPSITPSKESFDPLLRAILRRRLLRIFLIFAGVSVTLAALSGPDGAVVRNGGFVWTTWSSGVFLKALLWLAAGMVPIMVGRKMWAETYPPSLAPASLTQHSLSLLKSPKTTKIIFTHLISSLVLSLYSMPPLFNPSRRYPYSINPTFVAYLCASLSIGLVQGVRECVRARWVVNWTKFAGGTRMGETLVRHIPFNLLGTFAVAVLHTPIFLALYSFSLPTVLIPLSYLPLGPFLHSLRRSVSTSWPFPLSILLLLPSLFWKHGGTVLVLSVRNSVIWELAGSLVDIYFAQPLPLQAATPYGNDEKLTQNFVAGLSSENEYFSHHAFVLLAQLTETSTQARKTVYEDTKHQHSIWSATVNACLGLHGLGGSLGTLQRKGAPPPPPPAAPKVATRANVGTLPGTPVKLERTSIFKPSFETPRQKLLNDAFSSDGTAAKVLASAGSPLSWVPHALLAQAGEPEIAKKAIETAKTSVPENVVKPAETVVSAVKSGFKLNWAGLVRTPTWWQNSAFREYWVRARQEKVVKGWIRTEERDLKSIQILRRLVVSSLTEDSLGTVQRDIPKILEAFATYLTVVEETKEALVASIKPDAPEDVRIDMVKAVNALDSLRLALADALEDIVKTFKESLSVFRFAPKTARRLQIIVDQS
ncbi:hypothetical protein SISSUDRAFT_1132815 [Sistotremastrum suecicum HHB10207 ss-3]|uniref:Nucleoporin protein Ndc1-Nup n=1 Tax=Sistotremastrum suecicum HHB10207 ss-3 TaxID=1314776 RepID=A0A165Y8J1_9AGAM|nr:hypothetical protein SISSUDRAFT_1132815 [Sistotremastrum suecicum HHB10207 ss-3]